ncbi:MAG: LysR family transcriptional regulator [Eubacteriales bacterium]|nr:LysR family transcriptional regulator [Eubacteriales bacterium]
MEQNLSNYRAFYETATAGNISKAATRLGISQPAVSKAITKLETAFGTRLFVRTQRGVKLTPEGDVLFEHLSEAFSNIEKGEEELKHLRDYQYGYLKICSSSTLCKFFLMPYLKAFFEEDPYVKLNIENTTTAATINKIINQKSDIGAVILAKPSSEYKFEPFMEVEDIFVCTPLYRKRLTELYGADCDVFAKANIMLLDRGHLTRKHIDEYLRTEGITPKRLLEFPTMDMLIDMAKANMGVASVIREFVAKDIADGALIEVPIKKHIPKRKAGFAYLESNSNEALAKFLKSIR